jgi:hypothetical protein
MVERRVRDAWIWQRLVFIQRAWKKLCSVNYILRSHEQILISTLV